MTFALEVDKLTLPAQEKQDYPRALEWSEEITFFQNLVINHKRTFQTHCFCHPPNTLWDST